MEVNKVLSYINDKKELLMNISDEIFEAAEIRYKEYKSSNILCNALENEGFTVEKKLAGMPTAFSGSYGTGKPVIAILGEYDALSNMSQVCFASEKREEVPGGNGHGCGHNLLGVGSLGAAIAIKKYLEESKTSGTIIYFGCPAEEGGSGKTFMVREGLFEKVDCALTWHPWDTTGLFSGRSLANVGVKYKFNGISAHAAGQPHLGRSALDAVELMNIGANFLREHVEQDARIHYAITNSGGVSPNVVQAEAEVFYYIRAPKVEQVSDIYSRINKIAQGAALMTETDLEIIFEKAVASLVPNRTLDDILYKWMNEISLPKYTQEDYEYASTLKDTIKNPEQTLDEISIWGDSCQKTEFDSHKHEVIYEFVKPQFSTDPLLYGSTDVGDVSMVCPTAMIHSATWCAGTLAHSWQAVAQGKSNLAKQGMIYAASVLGCTAIDILEHPEKIQEAKQELNCKVGNKPYKSLIPKEVKPSI